MPGPKRPKRKNKFKKTEDGKHSRTQRIKAVKKAIRNKTFLNPDNLEKQTDSNLTKRNRKKSQSNRLRKPR